MSNAAAEFGVLDVDRTYFVLIPSRFPPIDIYARIAGGEDDAFSALESLTNPRLKERRQILGGVDAVDGNSPLVQNWNHAPFAYPNPEGTRFFGPELSALELAADLDTALAVSVARRELFLSATAEPATGLDMRVLSRVVRGRFADLRGLDPETPTERRRVLGRQVFEAGLDGLLFRPPDRPAGECLSTLRGETLGRAVQGEHFRFNWNGRRIDVLYDFRTATRVYPEDLRAKPGLAA
jgi:hypothetical protein